jgi:hypothetical protein
MAANVSVGVSGTTITVVITVASGSGYDPANASVQVVNGGTGRLLLPDSDTTSGSGLIRTLTYTGASGTGYTVYVSCGGEVSVSSVTTASAMVTIQ